MLSVKFVVHWLSLDLIDATLANNRYKNSQFPLTPHDFLWSKECHSRGHKFYLLFFLRYLISTIITNPHNSLKANGFLLKKNVPIHNILAFKLVLINVINGKIKYLKCSHFFEYLKNYPIVRLWVYRLMNYKLSHRYLILCLWGQLE